MKLPLSWLNAMVAASALASACGGNLDPASTSSEGRGAPGDGQPGNPPDPAAGPTSPTETATAEPGRTICTGQCTPSPFASVPRAKTIACSPEAIFVATDQGALFALGRRAPGAAVPVLPAASAAVGALTWNAGRLFYTLPSAGEVRVRDLATGDDVRLASEQTAPTGVTVRGSEVLFSTMDAVRSVSATGGPDQAPLSLVSLSEPGSSIGAVGARYVVAHGPTTAIAAYSATGEVLLRLPLFSKPVDIAATATAVYMTDASNYLWKTEAPLGTSLVALTNGQLGLAGLCVVEGRLYFLADGDIKTIDVE